MGIPRLPVQKAALGAPWRRRARFRSGFARGDGFARERTCLGSPAWRARKRADPKIRPVDAVDRPAFSQQHMERAFAPRAARSLRSNLSSVVIAEVQWVIVSLRRQLAGWCGVPWGWVLRGVFRMTVVNLGAGRPSHLIFSLTLFHYCSIRPLSQAPALPYSLTVPVVLLYTRGRLLALYTRVRVVALPCAYSLVVRIAIRPWSVWVLVIDGSVCWSVQGSSVSAIRLLAAVCSRRSVSALAGELALLFSDAFALVAG